MQDAAFEKNSKSHRQKAQGEASDILLRKMLRRADGENQRLLHVIAEHLKTTSQNYTQAHKAAESILRNYKPDPIGSVFLQIFETVNITIIFDQNARSEARAQIKKINASIRISISDFLTHLARFFSKLSRVEKRLLRFAEELRPQVAKIEEPTPAHPAAEPDRQEDLDSMAAISRARYTPLLDGLTPEAQKEMLKGINHLRQIRRNFRYLKGTDQEAQIENEKLVNWSFGWNILEENAAVWAQKNDWNPTLIQPSYLRFFKQDASEDFLTTIAKQAKSVDLSSDQLIASFLTDLRFLEFFVASQMMEVYGAPFRGAVAYQLTQTIPWLVHALKFHLKIPVLFYLMNLLFLEY